MTPKQFDSITIRTTARLHFGFIDLHGGLGRIFGSLGVAIDKPVCIVELQRKKKGIVISGEDKDRVKKLTDRLLAHFSCQKGFHLKVRESIPSHVGLGSGTQLALAIGHAVAMLCEEPVTTRTLSQILGRGKVSGIGPATFDHGGFVIDGGKRTPFPPKKDEGEIPSIIIRHPVPKDWHFVIAIPNVSKGISGIREKQAFQELPKGKASHAMEASRLVLMQLLPALIKDDIHQFGGALTRIQILVGDAFSTAQGGRFANSQVAECVKVMDKAGAVGTGQSSWGPTCYGLVRGLDAAIEVKTAVIRTLNASAGGTIFIATANNQGAQIATS